MTGNGTSKPRGLLTYPISTTGDAPGARPFGTLQNFNTGVSGAFPASAPADKLLDMIYAFNAGYRKNLTWVMTRTTLGIVRKFKDGQNNYIAGPRLQETLGSSPAIHDTIWGYPAKEFADMPELGAASLSVAVGDFSRGNVVIDRQGIRQLRDAYTDKPRVLFYTTKRVGGAVVDSDAIKLLQFS